MFLDEGSYNDIHETQQYLYTHNIYQQWQMQQVYVSKATTNLCSSKSNIKMIWKYITLSSSLDPKLKIPYQHNNVPVFS